MSDTAARIAGNAWDAQAHHARSHGHHHAQLVEVIDGMVIGDAWQGDHWPGGDPAVLLGDWCCHTRATHLVLVSPDVRTFTPGECHSEQLVVVVGRDGSSAVLIGQTGREPVAMSVVVLAFGNDWLAAMRRALQPADSQYLTA